MQRRSFIAKTAVIRTTSGISTILLPRPPRSVSVLHFLSLRVHPRVLQHAITLIPCHPTPQIDGSRLRRYRLFAQNATVYDSAYLCCEWLLIALTRAHCRKRRASSVGFNASM